MKRVLLHIGTGKTGTTSIHQTLARAAREQKLDNVAYPGSLRPPHDYPGATWPSHNFLAAVYMPFERLPRVFKSIYADHGPEALARDASVYRDGLLETLRAHDSVILSGEFLCQLSPLEVEALHSDLKRVGVQEVCVVLYVRSPASRYLSSVQQRLKASSQFGSPAKFKDQFVEILTTWSYYFANIVVRPFVRDKLEEGDVVKDLLAVASGFFGTEVAGPDLELRLSNESISAEAMMLLQSYRSCFYPDEPNVFKKDSTRLVKMLERSRTAIPQTKPRLKAEVARLVTTRHAEDLELLRSRFGVDLREEHPVDETRLDGNPSVLPRGRAVELDDIIESYDASTLQRLMLHCMREALLTGSKSETA